MGSRLSRAVRVGTLASALIAAAALGTAIGAAGGADNEWGCPAEQIGRSVFTPAEGGGYSSPQETLAANTDYLAADGAHDESLYADALNSRRGPDRFEPETGTLFINDRIEARIFLTKLADGTWTVDNEMLCMRPPSPELASPYPTPSHDEVTG